MDYLSIINKYYPDDDALRQLLLKHSRQVADRCLQIVKKHVELPVDVQFLEEAAMLHDIHLLGDLEPGNVVTKYVLSPKDIAKHFSKQCRILFRNSQAMSRRH